MFPPHSHMDFSFSMTSLVLDIVPTSTWTFPSSDLHYNWLFWFSSIPLTAFKLLPFSILWFLFPLQLEIEGMIWYAYIIPTIPTVLECILYNILFPLIPSLYFPTPSTSGLAMWLALAMECKWILYIPYLSMSFKCAYVIGSVSSLTLTFHHENSMYQMHMWPGTEQQNHRTAADFQVTWQVSNNRLLLL